MVVVKLIDDGNSYEGDSEWGIWYIYISETFTSDLSFVPGAPSSHARRTIFHVPSLTCVVIDKSYEATVARPIQKHAKTD
jgi:hypothetical protein